MRWGWRIKEKVSYGGDKGFLFAKNKALRTLITLPCFMGIKFEKISKNNALKTIEKQNRKMSVTLPP